MTTENVSNARLHKAVKATGTYSGASRLLADEGIEISRDTIRRRLEKEEDVTEVLDRTSLKGTSTLTNLETGQRKIQWVKTDYSLDLRKELMRGAFDAMTNQLPKLPPVKAPKNLLEDLLVNFTLTDAHIGMMAWGKETGGSWDLKIAERTIIGIFEKMINDAPNAAQAVLAQLGDFLHFDGLLPVTPTSGHVLDADSRFSKVVEVAIRILRRIIDMMLAKFGKVYLVIAEGNHDMASSVWLRHMFKALYENEPRVILIDSECPYYAMKFQKVMLFWHHSHLRQQKDLRAVAAAMYARIWGQTKFRYGHSGDKHHKAEKDEFGMELIQHPIIPPRDAYAARHAWFSNRGCIAITYHGKRGEIGRQTVTPEMLAA